MKKAALFFQTLKSMGQVYKLSKDIYLGDVSVSNLVSEKGLS